MTHARRIGPALAGPVGLEAAKAFMKVETEDEDDLILSLLAAAVNHAEIFTGRAVAASSWEWVLDGFPDGTLILPFGPVLSLDGIGYADADGVVQELDPASLVVDLSQTEARIDAPDGWPETEGRLACVTVTWTAGPGDEECPPTLSQAVLMQVSWWFDHTSPADMATGGDAGPPAVMALLRANRRFRG